MENYTRWPLWQRMACSFGVIVIGLLIVSPKDGQFYPEGNWLFGPLWLLLTRSNYDKLIGVLLSIILLPGLGAFFVKPGIWTGLLSIFGLVCWVAFGAFLAMLAVV